VIDWSSKETHFLVNPRLAHDQRRRLSEVEPHLPDVPGHIWILTSGTTQIRQMKWVALSKEAFLTSAKAVNEHLDSTSKDRWLLTLPTFHVGGLGILARSFLSGAEVIECLGPWQVDAFSDRVDDQKITLAALVPTQVYDLVKSGRRAGPSLRSVLVGGGALSADLYAQATELGYPLQPSYGLTECASQVATATSDRPELKILPHVEVRVESDGRLALRSKSLLTGWADVSDDDLNFYYHKAGEWFRTEDLGQVDGDVVTIFGRSEDQVKILGEWVLLPRLERHLETLGFDGLVVALPDSRRGYSLLAILHSLHLNTSDLVTLRELNESLSPFERLQQVFFLPEIPRSDLGKVKRAQIRRDLFQF
jgi:o-succinylbenzoate---CoA ligase